MAKFLTTSGVSHHIEEIIIRSYQRLVLVSPYLQLSKTFYERLKDASNRDVRITIIFGKDDLNDNEKDMLAELENVRIFYFKNLHAKCYFNDNTMVITSMNMYEFSEKNNREMGILIDRVEDDDLYQNALLEIDSIFHSSDEVYLRKTIKSIKSFNNGFYRSSKNHHSNQSSGYCIRCQERIPYNPEEPYCIHCFVIWNQFQNHDYVENVCHRCQKNDDTSMSKPQCYECFKIWISS